VAGLRFASRAGSAITAEIGLIGYTLLILLRNIVVGLDGVPADVREAATGMGFRPFKRLLTVDIPLALPEHLLGQVDSDHPGRCPRGDLKRNARGA